MYVDVTGRLKPLVSRSDGDGLNREDQTDDEVPPPQAFQAHLVADVFGHPAPFGRSLNSPSTLLSAARSARPG